MAAHAAWEGAKTIFGPFLFLMAVLVAVRAVAWVVKAKRGY